MTQEQANILIEKVQGKYSVEEFPIVKGMGIISQHVLREEGYWEHDQLWYGNFEESVQTMTEEEVLRLAQLGWFENNDFWSHF